MSQQKPTPESPDSASIHKRINRAGKVLTYVAVPPIIALMAIGTPTGKDILSKFGVNLGVIPQSPASLSTICIDGIVPGSNLTFIKNPDNNNSDLRQEAIITSQSGNSVQVHSDFKDISLTTEDLKPASSLIHPWTEPQAIGKELTVGLLDDKGVLQPFKLLITSFNPATGKFETITDKANGENGGVTVDYCSLEATNMSLENGAYYLNKDGNQTGAELLDRIAKFTQGLGSNLNFNQFVTGEISANSGIRQEGTEGGLTLRINGDILGQANGDAQIAKQVEDQIILKWILADGTDYNNPEVLKALQTKLSPEELGKLDQLNKDFIANSLNGDSALSDFVNNPSFAGYNSIRRTWIENSLKTEHSNLTFEDLAKLYLTNKPAFGSLKIQNKAAIEGILSMAFAETLRAQRAELLAKVVLEDRPVTELAGSDQEQLAIIMSQLKLVSHQDGLSIEILKALLTSSLTVAKK